MEVGHKLPNTPSPQLKKHYHQLGPILPSSQSTTREAYVASVEVACIKLPPGEADELRADTSHLLKNHCPLNKTNISREEHQDIKELRDDHTRVVLTVDKCMSMVVMDKQEYTDKALSLLSDTRPTKPFIRTPPPG